ncbi:uracil-xanthine permease [Rathayibacter rathayi]|uniref:uracil-xanthine permease family protein n=1 Tax=Rathayibacter rathayi TaxID=33887 RepID=UPI000BD22951|nr:solute carrier family 23 protein [Rathayibacter rathayi]AZZ49671.1 nitrate reductase [Rathayibacter rathayi]MWV75336.1 nitrate reductase [Rathayibacter rathayi NCPPB 2980 = VKM Ac-1601]PPF47914.1 nitrate reductase [Rathayibacter rathayi]PPG67822.1 nitrate reductase [Rathayibacter rathayi]PPG79487.1 nitrate reductase [Rathayibacter rathayi]
MPIWTLHGDGRTVEPGAVVGPGERLSWPATVAIGIQHVVAMFGATFLVPVLTGFPVATTLLFSGVGTLLFLLVTRNKLPSYLGSSFAFIAPVTAATTVGGTGSALAGVVAVGLLLAAVGVVVQVVGLGWIDRLMPPVVAGAIVALIGFNLAPTAYDSFEKAPLTGTITLAAIILSSVFLRGFLGRVSLFLGVLIGYVVALVRDEIDFSAVGTADWFGLPPFTFPDFGSGSTWSGIAMFLPVVLVLIAENVGHVRGVATMTDASANASTGRALIADGLATTLSGAFGGSGTTTYGENIGVMAATRVYSTAAYWVAGVTAILLSLSPKVGAVFNSIPAGVLGGATTALYGLVGVIGIKIWIDNRVDFSRPVNQYTAAVSFVIAIAGFSFSSGGVELGGIVLGAGAALVIYHLGNAIARWRRTGADGGGPLPAIGQLGGDPRDG